ncbi:MAG: hypothetical protein Q9182_001800 [Xanthomendoza sp. 2 TL-2023]
MREKKRKRDDGEASERLQKRRTVTEEAPAEVVKVAWIPDEDEWAPIIAFTPGLSLPPNLSMKPYKKPRKSNTSSTGKPPIATSEHLLHNSAHPKMDYVGREEDGVGADALLNHYIGVYDPKLARLQLFRARKMTLRANLRPTLTDTEEETNTAKDLSARSALGLTFGTKKAQRAIQNLTKNAISPVKQGPSTQGQRHSVLDPVASAVVSSMAAAAPTVVTREDFQAAIDNSAPRPRHNPDAETPAEAYPIDQLVGRGTLRQMTVKEWQDKVSDGQEILTKSRFVSHRIQRIASDGDVRILKTLKYLLLLIEWNNILLPGSKGVGRKIPQGFQLQEKVDQWGSDLVDGVAERFAEGGRTLSRWQFDNLMTHICALCVTVDPENFMTDVYDIREDLKLENADVRKYFKAIGCRVVAPTEAERIRWGLGKGEVASHQVAKLRLPLEFPKMRTLPVKGRR